MLLPRGIEHPTDGDATSYAAAYGVFIAAAVASMLGDLPANSRAALSHLADLFNTPVEQHPA